MRTYLLCSLILVGATVTTPLAAQVVPAAESRGFHLNVAATYSPARFNQLGGNSFWVQGGGIQVQHGDAAIQTLGNTEIAQPRGGREKDRVFFNIQSPGLTVHGRGG